MTNSFGEQDQLSLPLEASETSKCSSHLGSQTDNVVVFVDAATREMRRQAAERVKAYGAFSQSVPLGR